MAQRASDDTLRQALQRKHATRRHKLLAGFSARLAAYKQGPNESTYRSDCLQVPASFAKLAQSRKPVVFSVFNPKTFRVAYGTMGNMHAQPTVGLPKDIADVLEVKVGEPVVLTQCDLPTATFVQMQPIDNDLPQVDRRQWVEAIKYKRRTLRKGDVVGLTWGEQVFEFRITQVKPESPALAFDTDLELDFYMEAKKEEEEEEASTVNWGINVTEPTGQTLGKSDNPNTREEIDGVYRIIYKKHDGKWQVFRRVKLP